MQFFISEIHPFDDRNGRLSRIMMNAELVAQSQFKIIIPNVHGDNYLNGLRLASRDKNFRTYVKLYVVSRKLRLSGQIKERKCLEKVEIILLHITHLRHQKLFTLRFKDVFS
nr:hypothetical protein cemce18_00011 [uncultured bacterium]